MSETFSDSGDSDSDYSESLSTTSSRYSSSDEDIYDNYVSYWNAQYSRSELFCTLKAAMKYKLRELDGLTQSPGLPYVCLLLLARDFLYVSQLEPIDLIYMVGHCLSKFGTSPSQYKSLECKCEETFAHRYDHNNFIDIFSSHVTLDWNVAQALLEENYSLQKLHFVSDESQFFDELKNHTKISNGEKNMLLRQARHNSKDGPFYEHLYPIVLEKIVINDDVRDNFGDYNSHYEFIKQLYREFFTCLRCQFSGTWVDMEKHIRDHHDEKKITYVQIFRKDLPIVPHLKNFSVEHVTHEEMHLFEEGL